ncbi:hypothetical protein ZTR_02372 [Talaromyces verruculosus]|nr:hypothetical protein ZTR_02372 [Talaromyces verruculosus]
MFIHSVRPHVLVIIGGGTAGLVVASRLSEEPSTSVLVLEAGDHLTADPRVNIPIFYAALLGSEADWNFHSTPQTLFLFQGVVDSWEALGNPKWNCITLQELSPQAYSSPVVAQDAKEALEIEDWPGLNEAKGLIQTTFGNKTHPIRKTWAEFFRSNGQYNAGDPFIHSSVGSFTYYKPVEIRQNLHVLTNSHVEKILFDKSNPPRVIGVQYSLEGVLKEASARKEVILAAGALQSPKILELSGVGGAELLRKHGIDVVMDLPGVGRNLQDHLVSFTVFQAQDDLETKDSLIRKEPEALDDAMQEYTAT